MLKTVISFHALLLCFETPNSGTGKSLSEVPIFRTDPNYAHIMTKILENKQKVPFFPISGVSESKSNT
jgi:hypothetical protein